MPKAIKTCRVCGKEYETCHTARSASTAFRWQDVACSPECGAIYLAEIRASRKPSVPAEQIAADNDTRQEECAERNDAEIGADITEERKIFYSGKKHKKFKK